jgi:hypothetical protein
MRRAHARVKRRPVQRSRVRRQSSGEAPPRRPCLRRAHCRASHARVLGRAICGEWSGSRTPSRFKAGPPWTCEPRPRLGPRLPQPLDQRSMAQPSRFPLRVLGFSYIYMPVLPLLKPLQTSPKFCDLAPVFSV